MTYIRFTASVCGSKHPPLFAPGWRIARQILDGEFIQIVPPISRVVAPKIEQIVPSENPGRVHVVEHEPYGIIADRQHLDDANIALPGTVLRSSAECPCTSALGLLTRRYSAGKSKCSPPSNVTVKVLLSLCRRNSVGQACASVINLRTVLCQCRLGRSRPSYESSGAKLFGGNPRAVRSCRALGLRRFFGANANGSHGPSSPFLFSVPQMVENENANCRR